MPLTTQGGTPDPNQDPNQYQRNISNEEAMRRLVELYQQMTDKNALLNKEIINTIELDRQLAEELELLKEKMQGMSSEQKKDARRVKESIEEWRDQITLAEKYLSIRRNTVEEERKRREIEKAIQATGEKMGLDQSQINQAQDRMRREVAGGLLANQMTAWKSFAVDVAGLFNLEFQSQLMGRRARGAALMQGAGYGVTTSGEAAASADKMFGAFGIALSPIEKLEAFNKVMATGPKAYEANAEKMKVFVGTLGFFGATAEQMVDQLIQGARQSNLTTDDLVRIYRAANTMQRGLGLSTEETAEKLLAFTAAVRQIGGTSATASAIFQAFSGNIKGAGITLSTEEKLALAQKFTSGISNMPVDKLLGLTMFTKGVSLQGVTPEMVRGGGAVNTVRDTFQMISSQLDKSYGSQLVATEKVAQLVGINTSNLMEVEALQNILKSSSMSEEDMKRNLQMMAMPTQFIAKGIDDLTRSGGPLKNIENYTMQIMQNLLGVGSLMEKLVVIGTGMQIATGAAGVLGRAMGTTAEGVTAAAAVKWLRRGWLVGEGAEAAGAAEGTMALGALGTAVPLVAGGVATIWAANKLYDMNFGKKK